ncbi:MAG: heavy metal-binding domain-containing protein [Gemmataceae bacterium]
MITARLRFPLLVGMLLAILACWPYLRNQLEKWTILASKGSSVSTDTEFWCPMCPGVLSEWPAKCPVCNMSLIPRTKGEMTPLPDGVVARVQLTPYRIQLAGLRTEVVEYRRLFVSTKLSGPLNKDDTFTVEAFEPDASAYTVGQEAEITFNSHQSDSYRGRIASIEPTANEYAKRIRIRVNGSKTAFPPGAIATATLQTPLTSFPSSKKSYRQSIVDASLFSSFDPGAMLGRIATAHVAQSLGLTLAMPASATVETGRLPVAYTVSMPGVYDAVEFQPGRVCGELVAVRGGLEAGQRVVTTGSVLVDAESRLNPSAATAYFGAGNRSATSNSAAPALPSTEDETTLIAKQKICPVTGEPLGSMGPPVRVAVSGRAVFVCCKACEKPLIRKPDEYLSKLPK